MKNSCRFLFFVYLISSILLVASEEHVSKKIKLEAQDYKLKGYEVKAKKYDYAEDYISSSHGSDDEDDDNPPQYLQLQNLTSAEFENHMKNALQCAQFHQSAPAIIRQLSKGSIISSDSYNADLSQAGSLDSETKSLPIYPSLASVKSSSMENC